MHSTTKSKPGRPYPLGATWDGDGVNFAVYSGVASQVDLCLFERANGTSETRRIRMPAEFNGVWHAYVPGIRPGAYYGYRVHGPYAPQKGERCNPNKLLIDPYAKALTGTLNWDDSVYGYSQEDRDQAGTPDARDSSPQVPKSVVIDEEYDWGDDRPPRTPWSETIIYECHVKGLTARHPDVPPPLRGRYLGLTSEPVIGHLKRLGVTAVELLPVHHLVDERPLAERGLVNYWGYNPVAFFAPHSRYAGGAGGDQVREFKSMVKHLHRAGIEVILDVVFNHTAEGGHLGPTLSLRGLDNASYYRLQQADRRHYEDFSGCGNSLDMRHPRTLQLVMDCLRYYAQKMHVDGFRFDLATVLGRGREGFEREGSFLAAVAQDPILAEVKLIAEPWDLGPGGYQVGNFPPGWAEWNDKYQATMRTFWRGDKVLVGELGRRLSGSDDLYGISRRGPCASINYVACHDGFTLHDLVSHERKHNEENGEENRDGTDNSLSRNWGVEGPTRDPKIITLREQMKRNFMASLAFSLGVPMITAGDEIGRTQRGNNNAYCQDNEVSWVDWELGDLQKKLLVFTREVLSIRRGNPMLRRCTFLRGQPVCSAGIKDVTWCRPDGREMMVEDWGNAECRCLGMMLHSHGGVACERGTAGGAPATLLLIVSGGARALRFHLPQVGEPGTWMWQLDTSVSQAPRKPIRTGSVKIAARSLVLLRYEQG